MLKFLKKAAPLYSNIHTTRNSSKFVDVTVNNQGIAMVTVHRKPVNSLNLEGFSQLHKTLEQVESDNAKGMILTSTHNTVFSAGLDLMELRKPDLERLNKFYLTVQATWFKLYGLSIPTVAVINGHAPAGGCLLSLACEYRIMVNNFMIGLNETQLGIVPPELCFISMLNTIPRRQTELALSSGTLFTTEEALSIGLVDECAANKDEAMAKAVDFFKRFAKINPLARQMTKTECRKRDLQQHIDTKEQECQEFVAFINQPFFQTGLEEYIKSLKMKAKN